MQPSEIAVIKSIVAKQMPEGLDDCGLTFMGFLFLHAQFINNGHAEAMWTVLKKFGYDNDIKLAEDLIPTSFKRSPDQVIFHWGKLQLL
jgi:Ras family protein T1